MEWHKERQLAALIYQMWAPLLATREQDAFSSKEQWDRELGKRMSVAKAGMEKILGAEVSREELAERLDAPPESVSRLLDGVE